MTNQAKCKHLLGPLSEYISGEAAESLCAEIEAHMAECENCRIMVDTLRKTVVLYRTAPREAIPDDVRRRLFQVLDLNDYVEKHQDAGVK